MSTAKEPMYEWNALPWKTIERQVFKLQKRIYQASLRGDVKTVHKLQRLLMNSWSAKCLAVRRVTQDNKGKRTAGVDGVASLTPAQRLALVRTMNADQKARPLRRVWIPKPGSSEKRPLGIPAMADRALQALVKLALEPEWEAKFEPNSYGFRPGRSAHDAIEAIFLSIRYKPKFVLDADIAKCFDRINHEALLDKLGTYPQLRRLIKAWLKAGVMEGETLFPTEEGTPQGGVISPLLANIALHGFEAAITTAFPKEVEGKRGPEGKRNRIGWQPRVIRYADDFVILHLDLGVILEAKRIAAEWLMGMGLELKDSKTRITHTLNEHEGRVGFDFLGFNVRQFPVGESQRRTFGRGRILLDFITLIRPSKEAVMRHYQKVAEVINRHKSAPQEGLIKNLNPVIKGWCNYYSTVVSKRVFGRLEHLTCQRLLRWAKRRHPNASRWKTMAKYWNPDGRYKWSFATRQGLRLWRYDKTPIRRHVKVEGIRSPYDGDWVYWATRMGRYPMIAGRKAILLRNQKGKCPWCGLFFKQEDDVEIDHILPRVQGGKDVYANLQLLHGHCHKQKSAHDKGCAVEEPCELESLTHGFEDEYSGRLECLV